MPCPVQFWSAKRLKWPIVTRPHAPRQPSPGEAEERGREAERRREPEEGQQPAGPAPAPDLGFGRIVASEKRYRIC
jgi:hypothetical protein